MRRWLPQKRLRRAVRRGLEGCLLPQGGPILLTTSALHLYTFLIAAIVYLSILPSPNRVAERPAQISPTSHFHTSHSLTILTCAVLRESSLESDLVFWCFGVSPFCSFLAILPYPKFGTLLRLRDRVFLSITFPCQTL